MSMLHVCGYVGALWQANKQMCTINVDGKESVCVGRGGGGGGEKLPKSVLVASETVGDVNDKTLR